MKFRERGNGGVPPSVICQRGVCVLLGRECFIHLRSLFSRYSWNRGILEDAPIKEVHDVEVRANDILVLTETQCARNRDIGFLQCVDDSVFAIDLVRSLHNSKSAHGDRFLE